MLLACSCGLSGLFTTQASKRGARPEVVETRYNCGSRHPSRHASRTGWVVATHSPQQPLRFMKSQLSFSLRLLSFFLSTRISSLYCSPPPLLLVSRRMCPRGARCNSNIACGICVWISRNIYKPFARGFRSNRSCLEYFRFLNICIRSIE